jgi:TetR/AcrR family tetracycline transcriptional repressor
LAAPRNRTGLSHDDVAAEALRVVDAEGIDALSMRRLAQTLDIGTMTLYGRFRDKSDLLDAAVDIAARDFEPPSRRGHPRRQMETYMRAVHAWLMLHPALVEIRARQPIVRPAAFGVSEIGMQILLDAGLAPAEAAKAFRTLFNFVFGSVAFGSDRTAPGSLPGAAFPALATAMTAAAANPPSAEQQFGHGLGCILDGLGIE